MGDAHHRRLVEYAKSARHAAVAAEAALKRARRWEVIFWVILVVVVLAATFTAIRAAWLGVA